VRVGIGWCVWTWLLKGGEGVDLECITHSVILKRCHCTGKIFFILELMSKRGTLLF